MHKQSAIVYMTTIHTVQHHNTNLQRSITTQTATAAANQTTGSLLPLMPPSVHPKLHNMFSRTLMTCVLLLLCAGSQGGSEFFRRPSCDGMSTAQACPLNYSPVCGNDGVTYPNECSLCVYRLESNADILMKDGMC